MIAKKSRPLTNAGVGIWKETRHLPKNVFVHYCASRTALLKYSVQSKMSQMEIFLINTSNHLRQLNHAERATIFRATGEGWSQSDTQKLLLKIGSLAQNPVKQNMTV